MYVHSFKALLPTPEGQKLASQLEMEMYEKFEPNPPLDKPADYYKKVYCEKLQLEAQCEIQISQQAANAKNPAHAQQIALTLRT